MRGRTSDRHSGGPYRSGSAPERRVDPSDTRPGSGFRDGIHLAGFALAYGIAIAVSNLLPSSAHLILALWPAGGIGLASMSEELTGQTALMKDAIAFFKVPGSRKGSTGSLESEATI